MLDHNLRKTDSRRAAITAIALTLSFALAACGGGGAGGSAATANATVHGVVASVQGGLTVNGVTFATAGAVLTTTDASAPMTLRGDDAGAHLRPGMVVTVRGTVDDSGHGEAAEVRHQDAIEGEIEAHHAGEIVVGGVHVSLDDDTAGLDRRNGAIRPEDLPAGTRVAVSGNADARGGLRATLVRERDAAAEREVRAFVVAVNGTVLDLSFAPGGPVALRVDVSTIVPPPSFPVGASVEVEIRGPADASGVFPATAIHAEDRLDPEVDDEAEVEGIVTAGDGSAFTVAGQRVVTSAATVVRGGTLADVVPGVKLEAEGSIQADGSLLARTVKLRASVRISASVEQVDAAGGTITVLGIPVRVTWSTERNGFSAVGDLAPGYAVEVRGIPTSDGAVDALRLDLVDTRPPDRAFLRGVVTAKAAPASLTIVGIAVDLSGASLGESSAALGSVAALLDAVVPGETVVKVRWRPYPSSTADAVDEVEIED